MSRAIALVSVGLLSSVACTQLPADVPHATGEHFSIAGVYPHLAMYNSQGEKTASPPFGRWAGTIARCCFAS